MGEKNILAHFNTPERAEEAAARLKSLHVIDMSIDRIGRYQGEGIEETLNPLSNDFEGLGKLTLDADFRSRSAGIMAAADPSASGMSDGGQGGPTGKDILLTVVVQENDHKEALRLIQEAGGEV